jgi:PAS domain S-box
MAYVPIEKPGQFIEVNTPACRMLQYSYDELRAKTISDITPGEFLDRDNAIIDKIRKSGQDKFEGYMVRKDSTLVPVEISAHFFELDGRNVVLSVARDIRDRKEMASRQKEALIQIERNIHQLALLNDQIRNPLSVIVAVADTVEDAAGDKIMFHALEINRIISLLDKGWMESAKIHDFLTKHYNFTADYTINRYNDPYVLKRGDQSP